MDPVATLERIREAYNTNNFAEVKDGCLDLLTWIRKGGSVPKLSEQQFSALLIMGMGYGEQRVCQHAPEYGA